MPSFRRIIKGTQAKFQINENESVISQNNRTQQSSYNLPQEFMDYAIENGVIVEDETIDYSRRNSDGNAYRLSDDYSLELSSGILWMIGNEYRNINNQFITSQNEASDGTKKWQLFRKVYNDLKNSGTENARNYAWFVELYDKNLVGNTMLFEVDTENHILKINVEMNAVRSTIDNQELDEKDLNCDIEVLDEIESYQVIYYGVPGTGKSYKITQKILESYPEYKENEDSCEFVYRTTLHQEYDYYDFVGSITPKVTVDSLTGERNISYDFAPGVFTRALCEAFKPENREKKIFLILEEMSRANVAAVFGDIFQLLDRDDSGKSEYKIKNDLISNEIYRKTNVELKEIYLPDNFYIYGSVNTSDQNVFVMDNAFKRRFEFKYVGTEPCLDENGDALNNYAFNLDVDTYRIEWIDFYQRFNHYVTKVLQLKEDKQIGQFFIKFKKSKDENKADEYNYRQIYNKLLQYMWTDIHMNIMSKSNLFEGVDNFEDAYIKLKKHENIFNQDFIGVFKVRDDQNEGSNSENDEGLEELDGANDN